MWLTKFDLIPRKSCQAIVWKLQNLTVTNFWQKFREKNFFTNKPLNYFHGIFINDSKFYNSSTLCLQKKLIPFTLWFHDLFLKHLWWGRSYSRCFRHFLNRGSLKGKQLILQQNRHSSHLSSKADAATINEQFAKPKELKTLWQKNVPQI